MMTIKTKGTRHYLSSGLEQEEKAIKKLKLGKPPKGKVKPDVKKLRDFCKKTYSKGEGKEWGFTELYYKGVPIIQKDYVPKNEVWIFNEDADEEKFLNWYGVNWDKDYYIGSWYSKLWFQIKWKIRGWLMGKIRIGRLKNV